jgi:integrase
VASVEKRVKGDGTTAYIVKWREPNGRHRTKGGFPTRKAASAYATKVEEARLRGVAFDPQAGKVLFRDLAAKWLAARHDLKETTLAAYRDALAPTAEKTVQRHKRLANLRIDAVFGDYPINRIARDDIRDWVARMKAAGKKPSTVRNAYFLVRQVLGQAVVDGLLESNPADYVKLPTDYNSGRTATVDDPTLFLTAAQVAALVAATPWPYDVLVHLAAWSGLRAAELAGLVVGDLTLPPPNLNPNAPARPGALRVERTAVYFGDEPKYIAPKTKGSRRTVPLTAATTGRLRDYLAEHPRANDSSAPLFPGMSLVAPRPTGVRAEQGEQQPDSRAKAYRQAWTLANLSVTEATARLRLDWDAPVRHATFYKAVYRPAVLRANRMTPSAALPPGTKFHALRHTYASLCIAAGRPALEVARFMGHARPSTTEAVYAHLFNTDDHAGAMAALGAMGAAPSYSENVVPLHG